MFVTEALMVIVMTVPVPDSKPVKLSPEQVAAARAAVYDTELATESPNRDGMSVIIVPEAIAVAYLRNAVETESLLFKIIEGGNPADSIKAVSYLLELRDGPGSGIPAFLAFNYQTWDKIDKDWKQTPRDHWVAQLKKNGKGK